MAWRVYWIGGFEASISSRLAIRGFRLRIFTISQSSRLTFATVRGLAQHLRGGRTTGLAPVELAFRGSGGIGHGWAGFGDPVGLRPDVAGCGAGGVRRRGGVSSGVGSVRFSGGACGEFWCVRERVAGRIEMAGRAGGDGQEQWSRSRNGNKLREDQLRQPRTSRL